MEASITLKKVGKLINDETILAGLSFGVERGSLVAIVGDHETGKTALLQMLCGLEKPDYGHVFINGLDMSKRIKNTRRIIGFVPHENDFDPWLTIKQNILFNANLHNVNKKYALNKMIQYAKHLGFDHLLNRLSSNLSLGVQKKAMIVRSIIHDPEILILDEPTGFMDAASIRLTWDLLKEFKGEKTVIYVSNSLYEVEQAHDRILVFNNGRIIMDGNLDKLLESTIDYHQFQIEFEYLSDELYKSLCKVSSIVSPNKMNNIFHFYGRKKNVFFDVIKVAKEEMMIDLNIKKLGLRDLMDSEFAGQGLE